MSKIIRNKTLVIIDGHALLHRAYHALPPLTTQQGVLVNGAYGFFLVFLKMVNEIKPDYLACCFDLPGETFRHKKYKQYKAKRVKAPEELYQQTAIVKEILTVLKVPVFEEQSFEADDLIGTIVRQVKPQNFKTVIVTGDLDTLQLVSDKVNVYTLGRGVSQAVIYDPAAVKKRFELKPEQMIDFKALKGDPSDNIPGVPGIGEKTAICLLKEFKSLKNLYQLLAKDKAQNLKARLRQKLIDNRDQAFFSQELVVINCEVPLKFNLAKTQFGNYDEEAVKQVFKKYGFSSLLKRLPPSSMSFSSQARGRMGKGLFSVENSELSGIGSPPEATKAKEEQQVLEQIEELYRQKILSPKIYHLEKSLVPVISQMQAWGIKLDIDYLNKLNFRISEELQNISHQIFELTGQRFNPNSPQQLSEVLFSKLGLSTKGLRKTPGGAISTSAAELNKIRRQHPIIEYLEKHRELVKLKSTYVDALPRLANLKTGRLQATFHQLGTETGRLSCSHPNLQNIPIRTQWGQAVRRAFVAERGFQLLSADYSQIDLRIAAILSKDKDMLAALTKGQDIHRVTASRVFNVDLAEVSEKQRRLAKRLNFGILYGIGPRSFAASAEIPLAEAKKFIQEYFQEFKGIAQYLKRTREFTRQYGYAKTFFGRRRPLLQIHSSDPILRRAAERMAINLPIQGTTADLMKMAMVNLRGVLNPQVRLICQIHDELLFEIKDDIILEVAPEIKQILEDVYRFPLKLKAEIKHGSNWADLKDF